MGAVGRSIALGAVYPLFIEALALEYERSLVVRYRSSDLQTKANNKAFKEKSFDSNPFRESRFFRSINSEISLSSWGRRSGADRRRRTTAGTRTSAETASLSPLPLGRDRPTSFIALIQASVWISNQSKEEVFTNHRLQREIHANNEETS